MSLEQLDLFYGAVWCCFPDLHACRMPCMAIVCSLVFILWEYLGRPLSINFFCFMLFKYDNSDLKIHKDQLAIYHRIFPTWVMSILLIRLFNLCIALTLILRAAPLAKRCATSELTWLHLGHSNESRFPSWRIQRLVISLPGKSVAYDGETQSRSQQHQSFFP